ncbi:MAG: holo-ACP synthase [Clostridia bacterium]|nr:holo-ACP synthase [Clostridia bacterium]MBN2883151.1 holo-ACP synthase [Clostridia bacterium]
MNISCGTDIVEVSRIKKSVQNSPSFTNRVYSVAEQEYCLSRKAGRFQSLAARFAAKEAVSKALGTGIGENAELLDIEISNDSLGKPLVVLKGKALKTFKDKNGEGIEISLSHSHDYAVAFAVLTFKEE